MSNAPAPPPTCIVTKEYRRFMEVCEACRQYRYIGVCYGAPGVGKTWSATSYTKWSLIQAWWNVFLWPDRERPPIDDLRHCRSMLYTAPVVNSPGRILSDITQLRSQVGAIVDRAIHLDAGDAPRDMHTRHTDYMELLIIDEADRLKAQSLEQVRDIADQTQIGIILMGMPGFEKRLSRYAQLYSRVGFVHQFRALSAEELRFILEQRWKALGMALDTEEFTDMEAVATIVRITGGNFRLIQRLFTQIERILTINNLHGISKEVIEAARENLVIGVV
ncbi:MAG: AAA family ATPase [Herpetosiphonaceae bacterium]|nr:AAA family ATPase [Herpetosiphonaceae bacterium]